MRKLVIGLIVVLAAGCSPAPSANIGANASAVLRPKVAAIRSAAVEGDRSGAARQLDSLRTTVTDLVRRAILSQEDARTILDAAADVEENLGLIQSRQSTPLQRPPSAAPPPSPTAIPSIVVPSQEPSPVETQKPEEENEEGNEEGNEGPGSQNSGNQKEQSPQGNASGTDGADEAVAPDNS